MTMPPVDTKAELALLARMKQGDESAFVALYRKHRDAVYRFALLYAGSPAIAADVTQDTFVHLMTQHRQFDPTRGSIGAWLCGVARNMARKQCGVREDATDPAELQDDARAHDSQVDHQSPLDRLLRGELAEHVRRAVAGIAPHYRDVLTCARWPISRTPRRPRCAASISAPCARAFRAPAPSSHNASPRTRPPHAA